MSTTLICMILGAELSAIPSWVRTTFKGYYNNALCNGATWMLVFWKILHVIYGKLMDVYLRRIVSKHYIRTRLTKSIWYCGFFTSTLAYCLIPLDGKNLDLLRGSHMTPNDHLPTELILTYTAICTFYLHTALFEGIQCESLHSFLKYLSLVAICTLAYILRLLTVSFTLSALIAITSISEEVAKIFYSLLNKDKFIGALYFFNIVLFIFIYLIIIPIVLLAPLGKMIASNDDDPVLIMLFSFLLCWLVVAIYRSILSDSILHWIYHTKEEFGEEGSEEAVKRAMECPGNIIECALFSVRTDDAYVLSVLRAQMKKRKLEMDAKKKPKTKSLMLIQTIKCMMAIRKKLNEKKNSGRSDSDERSEHENDNIDEEEEFEPECESESESENRKNTWQNQIVNDDMDFQKKNDTSAVTENIHTVLSGESKHSHESGGGRSVHDSETVVAITEFPENNSEAIIGSSVCEAGDIDNVGPFTDNAFAAKDSENFKSCHNFVSDAVENVETDKLLPNAEEELIVPEILDDIVNNKLNITEPSKLDEASLKNKNEGDSKSKITLSTSYKQNTDRDE